MPQAAEAACESTLDAKADHGGTQLGGMAMAMDAARHVWRTTTPPHRLAILAVGLALALALTLMLPAPTAQAANGCSVKNMATGRTYATLQLAVDAARSLQTLVVRGTCHGATVISKDVQVRGVRGGRWGLPRLRADRATVLSIRRGATVTVASLLIAGGKGVINRGTATFRDVRVKGDVDLTRRGILNSGKLRLVGESWVRRTGGIVNSGHLTLGGTTAIRSNVAPASVKNTGTLVMNGQSNVGNNGHFRCCGGIENAGRMVMNHRSSLTDQLQDSAVTNTGTLVMNDRTSIHHNSDGGAGHLCVYAPGSGGGVHNQGKFMMQGRSSIHHNSAVPGESCPEDIPGHGGGIYNEGVLVMRGSATVRQNVADYGYITGEGGGIYNAPGGTVTGATCGPGGNVRGNTPDNCYFAESAQRSTLQP